MGKKYLGYIIGAVLVLAGIWFAITFNSLVKKDELVLKQFNEVQNAYQRRVDLIPNLVNVVKGGAAYEQTTLQKVIEARAKAGSMNVNLNDGAGAYLQQTAAQDNLASSANNLIIKVESYPELRGTRAFVDLQVQLEGTERRIKFARRDFNEAIADYNSKVKSFPVNLVAGITGFSAKDGFASDAGAENAVEINFKK